MTVSVGIGLQGARRERHVQLRGYARHRREYDARRRLNVRDVNTKAYMALLRGDPCWCCGHVGAGQHVDHITPLNRGGSDVWANMTASCANDNRRRGDQDVLGYLLGRLAC